MAGTDANRQRPDSPGRFALELVAQVELALADLAGSVPGGLSPIEAVAEQRVRQAAARLIECAEELAAVESLVVQGSMKQLRPHPLVVLEEKLRREIVDALRDLCFRATNRATIERLRVVTAEEPE